MRLIDTDKLKFPNIAVFEMKLHGTMVPMVRLLDLKELMPAVDAVPVKHGKWVMMGGMKPREDHHHHQCSVCESYAPMQMPYGAREVLSPFCPTCGAKMDLGEE